MLSRILGAAARSGFLPSRPTSLQRAAADAARRNLAALRADFVEDATGDKVPPRRGRRNEGGQASAKIEQPLMTTLVTLVVVS